MSSSATLQNVLPPRVHARRKGRSWGRSWTLSRAFLLLGLGLQQTLVDSSRMILAHCERARTSQTLNGELSLHKIKARWRTCIAKTGSAASDAESANQSEQHRADRLTGVPTATAVHTTMPMRQAAALRASGFTLQNGLLVTEPARHSSADAMPDSVSAAITKVSIPRSCRLALKGRKKRTTMVMTKMLVVIATAVIAMTATAGTNLVTEVADDVEHRSSSATTAQRSSRAAAAQRSSSGAATRQAVQASQAAAHASSWCAKLC